MLNLESNLVFVKYSLLPSGRADVVKAPKLAIFPEPPSDIVVPLTINELFASSEFGICVAACVITEAKYFDPL